MIDSCTRKTLLPFSETNVTAVVFQEQNVCESSFQLIGMPNVFEIHAFQQCMFKLIYFPTEHESGFFKFSPS